MWKKAGLAAALVVALAVPAAVHAVRAAPPALPPRPATFKPGQTFTPVCKASEILDSRPDPAWAGASFAGDNCRAPALPMPLNGASATRAQIVAAMAAAKRYAVLSGAYQKCIADFVAARKARSAATQANTPLFVIENHRILVSQENSRKARRQMDAAIDAFNEYGSECPGQ